MQIQGVGGDFSFRNTLSRVLKTNKPFERIGRVRTRLQFFRDSPIPVFIRRASEVGRVKRLAAEFMQCEVLCVANRPRYGCYLQARIAIQLDRYQKDSEALWWADTRQTGEFPMSIYNEAGPLFPI
jgi:hypothetical protein